ETQPPARDRADQALFLAAVVQGAAGRGDPGGEGRFGGDAAGPDRVQQGVPGYDTVTIADPGVDEIENLRLDRDGRPGPRQLAAVRIKDKILEFKRQNRLSSSGLGQISMSPRCKISAASTPGDRAVSTLRAIDQSKETIMSATT